MQSGISASAELKDAFQTLLTNPSQRGLLVGIENESIVPLDPIPSTTSSFFSDLSNLAPHLKPNRALYILLRRDPPRSASFVAATYVPDAAPVRQKMLTASTRLTLVRELGAEHFDETLFATTAEELSAEGWRKHEAHVGGARPLTEEEQNLEGIKEAEAQESGGTGIRRGHVNSRVEVRMEDGVLDAVKAMQSAPAGDLLQLKMDVPTETLTLVSTTSVQPSQLASAISETEPRYSFYKAPSTPSSSEGQIIFIYTCPTASRVRERMLYASAKRSVVILLGEQEAGLQISKRLEASDPEELTSAIIDDAVQPSLPESTPRAGFAKPKRPGRR